MHARSIYSCWIASENAFCAMFVVISVRKRSHYLSHLQIIILLTTRPSLFSSPSGHLKALHRLHYLSKTHSSARWERLGLHASVSSGLCRAWWHPRQRHLWQGRLISTSTGSFLDQVVFRAHHGLRLRRENIYLALVALLSARVWTLLAWPVPLYLPRHHRSSDSKSHRRSHLSAALLEFGPAAAIRTVRPTFTTILTSTVE